MPYRGDIRLGDTLDFKFTTRQFTTGTPFTLAGTPSVAAYPGNSTTEITAGITLSVDFDARTGLNNVRIAATGGNGYVTATDYEVVITAGTVDGVSVVGEVVGAFSIEKRSALMPTTATRTLDVSTDGDSEANVTKWLGTAAATPTVGGVPEVDVTHWIGTAAATPTVAGVPEVDVTHFNGTAGTFASGRPEVNTSHVSGTAQTAGDIIGDTNDIQARLPAGLVGGRMDSSVGAYASGMTPLRPSATGTADSGSTTTLVDTERTEADTDYWRDCIVKFTSGTLNGQTALITAFNPATDTVTFAPATTVAVGTHTYEIYPMSRVDLHLVLGSVINALIAGRIDANTQAMANDVVTASVIATGAIDADAIADNAIDAGAIAADAITAAKIANGAIDAATFAAGAIDAAAIATDAIDGDALAASALTEIKTQMTDALNVDTYAEIGQETPAATQTIRKMLGYLYKAWRNRSTQTSTQYSLYNDDTTTIAHKATVSDDGTTFDKGEVATGP